MKRTIVFGAVVALLASGAYAASITALAPTGTGTSSATSISADGLWVAGAGTGTQSPTPYTTCTYWYGPTGAATEYTTKGAGYYGGIDSGGGNLWTSANAGTTVYSSGNFIGRAGSHVAATPSLSILLPSSETNVGGNNSAAYSPLAGDGFYVGRHTKSPNEGYVWKWGNGLSPWRTVTGTGTMQLKSISQTVRVIGNDRGGTGGGDRAIWVEAAGTTVNQIPLLPGSTYVKSQGNGISTDGLKYTGYMHRVAFVTAGTDERLQAFVWTQGDADSTRLLPAGGDLINEQGNGFDVTDDGVVVGYTWRTDTGNKGCIWLPTGSGYTNALRLEEWLPTIGVDLTGWTSLSTATGVAPLGNGQYAITGTGTYNGSGRAYYIVTPEPAMAFMALSGLALLLRRRR